MRAYRSIAFGRGQKAQKSISFFGMRKKEMTDAQIAVGIRFAGEAAEEIAIFRRMEIKTIIASRILNFFAMPSDAWSIWRAFHTKNSF